ncbi:hypothetical protein niasHS_015129 [Heterodera schachtii]|uniref:Uncharacterized protein n=2 Tax=Heterodera TaxID=34509 RepID=A0ABD2KQT6_9BILA
MTTTFKTRTTAAFDEICLGNLEVQQKSKKKNKEEAIVKFDVDRPGECPSVKIVIIFLFVTAPFVLFSVMVISYYFIQF